jgi:hypothetical protein
MLGSAGPGLQRSTPTGAVLQLEQEHDPGTAWRGEEAMGIPHETSHTRTIRSMTTVRETIPW